MYIPSSFQVNEPEKLTAFMNDHSFATLVSYEAGVPFASHLPLRCFEDDDNRITLVGHMAIANPQWKHFVEENELLAIFHGPHSYISPTWYSVQTSVPTWNYASIHAYGMPKIISDEERVVSILAETVTFYEQGFDSPWSGELPADYQAQLIKAIIAFEIRVTRIEGKYKLGQNRSEADRQQVHDSLMASSQQNAIQLAQLMKAEGLACAEKAADESTEASHEI
ncbi:Protease synthase and sporulation protein PAI 2 [Rubripirellula tenax]|uniref:Protease synthase and sporulation protein PAI 2 n=1 Tax=Rubripirellula tenax TaxID=2528015 RepID=A0A5C6ELG0_9BACT|nr:FMN-binding negative transcriptional regulator [Rubripirellula tenax]TWU48947.1 Protease synthase and sporulation protein PAI 2 [Rubripirellula tenax]